MSRQVVVGFAVLVSGCIPVTEPLGEIDKSEPDKALVGEWSTLNRRGAADFLRVKSLTVDIPEVKGNPKGLMRGFMAQADKKVDTEVWFFTTAIGKHTYATILVGSTASQELPLFGNEGDFAKWRKEKGKQYYIFRYTRDGDRLTLDGGNLDSFMALMKDAKIKSDGSNHFIKYYETPAGWLAKYLDKTGPDDLFDGTNKLVLARQIK
jgi:hypothetical protein